MRVFFIIIFILAGKDFCLAQSKNDSNKTDSNIAQRLLHDTAVNNATLIDSTKIPLKSPERNYQSILNNLLSANKFINLSKKSVPFINRKREAESKDYLFYLLSIIILFFALFKGFYSQYFNNVFRVFFNTSLRQNQLTDLLLQATLPSLILNIVFVTTSGLYAWLLLRHFNKITNLNSSKILLLSVLIVSGIYIIKFLIIKFIGWITGMKEAADAYIFVVFLINKIIGVILIPFIILIAFGMPSLLPVILMSSFFILAILFLLRFFRSYNLLQGKIEVRRLPFMLYIIAVEILPFLIIYKWITTIV